MTAPDRRRRRVVESHRIAVAAFRLAGVFAGVAASWAGIVSVRGGSWWGPLHAFLAGVVLLAISGATQLFTITWAAAVPPTAAHAAAQRWSSAAGAGLALAGVALGVTGLTVTGAAGIVAGLVLLAASLLGSVRRSLLRRFDLSSRFYLLAIACALVAVPLGAVMAAGAGGEAHGRLRLVHGHLNLIGFVGFTIVGTLPTILATFAHHRAVSGREATVGFWLSVGAATAIASHLLAPAALVGAGSVLAGMAAVLVAGGVVARLRRRGLEEGGLPYRQVVVGTGWLAAWAVAHGIGLMLGGRQGPFSPGLGAAVLAGVGQVLAGSLAYLVPVLIGPAPRLGRNLDRMSARGWVPLLAANGAGISLVAGLGTAATVLAGVWFLDFARRLASLEWRRGEPPPVR